MFFSVVLGSNNMRVGLPVPGVLIGDGKGGKEELKIEWRSTLETGFFIVDILVVLYDVVAFIFHFVVSIVI